LLIILTPGRSGYIKHKFSFTAALYRKQIVVYFLFRISPQLNKHLLSTWRQNNITVTSNVTEHAGSRTTLLLLQMLPSMLAAEQHYCYFKCYRACWQQNNITVTSNVTEHAGSKTTLLLLQVLPSMLAAKRHYCYFKCYQACWRQNNIKNITVTSNVTEHANYLTNVTSILPT
jgi:hypothetical protein